MEVFCGALTTKSIKSFDVQKIYWDVDGNLRQGTSDRKREEELLHVLERDCGDDSDPTQVWVVIPSRWIRNWLLFAHLKLSGEPPGPIDIGPLIKEDPTAEGGWRPKNTLQPPSRNKIETGDYAKLEFDVKPGQYRRIPYQAWEVLVSLYGQTEPKFCIAVKGNTEPTPASDINRWRIFKHNLNINPAELPDAKVLDIEEVKKEQKKKKALFAAMGLK